MLKYKYELCLVLVVLLSSIRLFLFSGLPNGHDIDMEMVRLVEYRHALTTQIIPRFAEHIYFGFGAPVFVFYAPLFLFLSSLASLAFPIEIAVKLIIILLTFVGTLGVFKWLSEFFSRNTAFATSIVFAFTAYRSVDIFARNAFSEFTAFMLLPCVLWGITCLLRTSRFSYRKWLAVVAVFASFLLSHNITILISIPFLLLYTGFVWWQNREKKSGFSLLLAGVFAVGLAAFFLLPAFFKKGLVNTAELLQGKFMYFHNYASLEAMFWDMTAMFYIPLILVISAFSPVCVFFRKYRWKGIYAVGLFWVLSAGFMMLPGSDPVWQILPLLHFAQFPWRFMVIFSVGILPMLASFFSLFEHKKFWYIVASSMICAIMLPHFILYLKEDSRFTFYPNEITTERVYAENMRLTVGDEYLPFLTRDVSYPQEREIIKHTVPAVFPKVFEQTIDVPMESNIELPLFVFPYFDVHVDGEVFTPEKTASPLLILRLLPGRHHIEVFLGFTPLHAAGVLVSLLTLLSILGYGIVWIFKKKQLHIV